MQRLLSNCRFLASARHFLQGENAIACGLTATINAWCNSYDDHLKSFRAAIVVPDPIKNVDLEELASGLLSETREKIKTLTDLTAELLKAWKSFRGYYYQFSDTIDRFYHPRGCSRTVRRCVSCGSQLRRRLLQYAGDSPNQQNENRVQFMCPRCLVVLDCCVEFEEAFELDVHSKAPQLNVTLRYTNRTTSPQWVACIAESTIRTIFLLTQHDNSQETW